MVVSGVPEVVDNHAEKLACMAVDMMSESKSVINPYTKRPLQARGTVLQILSYNHTSVLLLV